MNENQYEMNEEVKQKKGNKKVLFVVIVVVLIALGLGVYKFVFDNPKNIFLNAINNELKQFDGIFETVENGLETKQNISSTSSLDFNITVQDEILDEDELGLLNEINALNLVMNAQYDQANKYMVYDMNLKYDTSDLFNMAMYAKPNSFYVDLKSYFDKYIEIPVEDYETLFENQNQNVEDMEYVISFTKDSFLNNLDKKEFVKSKETIQIGNESIKSNKITYVFTERKMNVLIAKILEDMKKDDKFIEVLSSLSQEDKSDIKDSIEEAITELNDNLEVLEESDESIEISVYTKGFMNEAIQFSMVVNSDTKDEIRYSNYNGVKKISMLEDNQEIINIVNEKENESTYKTTVTADTLKLVINSTQKDDNWNHTYKLTESESEAIISGEITSTTKEISKDEEYTNDIKFTASIGVEDIEDVMSIEIISSSTLKMGTTINIPDISNSILYTELTEEDMNTITANILNNQELINFINKISSYTTEDDYYKTDFDDTSYDYYDEDLSY